MFLEPGDGIGFESGLKVDDGGNDRITDVFQIRRFFNGRQPCADIRLTMFETLMDAVCRSRCHLGVGKGPQPVYPLFKVFQKAP